MNRAVAIKEAFAGLGLSGRVALVMAAVAIVIVAAASPALVRALLAPAPEAPSVAEAERQSRPPDYAALVGQIDGRSLFFIPDRPPAPPPPPVARDDRPPPPPPPPSRYGGPALMAMLGDIAWFADGKVLKVGEESGSIRLVSLDPPWSAVIEWQEVEFTVPLFDRDTMLTPRTESSTAPDVPEPPSESGASPAPSGNGEESSPGGAVVESAENGEGEQDPSKPGEHS